MAYTHRYRHRVRYRECDPMGVVYHANYLDYFEAARTEAMRAVGIVYSELEASGIFMPVIDAQIHYAAPTHYDDVLEITSRFEDEPLVRVETTYEARRAEEDRVLASGRVTLCFMDAERRRPVRAPASVLQRFKEAATQAS